MTAKKKPAPARKPFLVTRTLLAKGGKMLEAGTAISGSEVDDLDYLLKVGSVVRKTKEATDGGG